MSETQLTCRRCGASFSTGTIKDLLAGMRKGVSLADNPDDPISGDAIRAAQRLAYLALGLGCGECELGTNDMVVLDQPGKIRHAIDLIAFLLPLAEDLLRLQVALSLLIQERVEKSRTP